jgi:hypothetical protein
MPGDRRRPTGDCWGTVPSGCGGRPAVLVLRRSDALHTWPALEHRPAVVGVGHGETARVDRPHAEVEVAVDAGLREARVVEPAQHLRRRPVTRGRRRQRWRRRDQERDEDDPCPHAGIMTNGELDPRSRPASQIAHPTARSVRPRRRFVAPQLSDSGAAVRLARDEQQ